MNDILHEKTEVYRGAAKLPGTPRAAFVCLLALIAVCVLLFNLVSPLPYSAFFKVAVLVLTAVGINYILKQGTFTVTYVLTDDGWLVYVTKYGALEWESAHIEISKAKISGNKLICNKRHYDFYPDNELKELIANKKMR